jgi:hypothetical protein
LGRAPQASMAEKRRSGADGGEADEDEAERRRCA